MQNLIDVKIDENPITVVCANNSTMTSTHTGKLNIDSLPEGAKDVHIFKDIAHPLISLGKLCDNNMTVILTNSTIDVVNNSSGLTALSGPRLENGMFTLPLVHQNTLKNLSSNPSFSYLSVPCADVKYAAPLLVPVHSSDAVQSDTVSLDMFGTKMTPSHDTVPATPPGLKNDDYALSSLYSKLSTKQSIKARVNFISACFGNPSNSTLLKAANEHHLDTVPGITPSNILKHPTDSINTAKGHMDIARQHTWSTKHKNDSHNSSTVKIENDIISNTDDNDTLIFKLQNSNELFCDFKAVGHWSNNKTTHVLVAYSPQGRVIKTEPMCGATSESLIQAYNNIVLYFRNKNIFHTHIKIDHQTSEALETFLTSNFSISTSYVAIANHRTSHAERDIRTWQNHAIATFAGVDPDFPKKKWHLLLPLIEMTLQILRPCIVEKDTSSYDYVNKENKFNFSAHPFGPAGCKVLVFESAAARESMQDHGTVGYFIGPAMKFYRGFACYIPSTNSIRTSDTVSWHVYDPTSLLSNYTLTETISKAVSDIQSKIDSQTDSNDNPILSQCVTLLNEKISEATCLPVTNEKLRSVPNTSVHLQTDIIKGGHNIRSASTTGPAVPFQRVPLLTEPVQQSPPAVSALDPVPIQRVVAPTCHNPPQPVKIFTPTRTGSSLKNNKNYVKIDAKPIFYDVTKILSHRGKSSNPLKPLRFLVRWHNFSSKHDTYEPWEHIKDCQAAKEYVDKRKYLWYLYAPSMANEILPQSNDDPFNFWQNKTHNAAIAYEINLQLNEITAHEKQLNTYLLYKHFNLPIDNTMNDQVHDIIDYAFNTIEEHTENESMKFRHLIKGRDKDEWLKSDIKEFHKQYRDTETIRPILFDNIPPDKKPFISYYNRQCRVKMKSSGPDRRVRGTFGGNKKSGYKGVTSSYQANMVTTKLLLNKAISDVKSKCFTMDITDMYLQSKLPPDQYEYMVMDISDIPEEIIQCYNLRTFIRPGTTKIYNEVIGALYGMKQSGYIANKELVTYLESNGYMQSKTTPCLFKHNVDDIDFTLITDDFLIRYSDQKEADKLYEIMCKKYPMTVDWTCRKYAGLDILFDYSTTSRKVSISMKGYIAAVLKRFHIKPTHNVYSPEFFTPIHYGCKTSQLIKIDDTSEKCNETDTTLVQQIAGSMLYYAIGIDATMRPAIDHIAMEQANPTKNTLDNCYRLLHYAATFPNATITYKPSDMILIANGDASYNSETNARSRGAVIIWCGKINDTSFHNGPIECISTLLPTIVASAAEAEYATLFIAGKSLLPLRNSLHDLGHDQPPTIIITDNEAAKNIANNTCKIRRSKSIDMRYHWIRDRIELKDFKIVWEPGETSIADYMSKIQPVQTVLNMRKYFVDYEKPTFPLTKSREKDFLS